MQNSCGDGRKELDGQNPVTHTQCYLQWASSVGQAVPDLRPSLGGTDCRFGYLCAGSTRGQSKEGINSITRPLAAPPR